MVLKLKEDLWSVYDEILWNSLKGGTSVYILVSNDIDSMAALKILTVRVFNLELIEVR